MRQCRPTGISHRFIMVTVGDLIGGVGNDSFDNLCMACTQGCRRRSDLCDGSCSLTPLTGLGLFVKICLYKEEEIP
jgi:hypothetical protein